MQSKVEYLKCYNLIQYILITPDIDIFSAGGSNLVYK